MSITSTASARCGCWRTCRRPAPEGPGFVDLDQAEVTVRFRARDLDLKGARIVWWVTRQLPRKDVADRLRVAGDQLGPDLLRPRQEPEREVVDRDGEDRHRSFAMDLWRDRTGCNSAITAGAMSNIRCRRSSKANCWNAASGHSRHQRVAAADRQDRDQQHLPSHKTAGYPALGRGHDVVDAGRGVGCRALASERGCCRRTIPCRTITTAELLVTGLGGPLDYDNGRNLPSEGLCAARSAI